MRHTDVKIAVFPASDGPSSSKAVPFVLDFRRATRNTRFRSVSTTIVEVGKKVTPYLVAPPVQQIARRRVTFESPSLEATGRTVEWLR